MKRLLNKNIYYVITGAPKARFAKKIITEMVNEGANVFTIVTKAGQDFVDLRTLKNIRGNVLKLEWDDKTKLPKEDAVLIAPCTFNSLNAIVSGRADSYPMCLIASSISRGVPIIIAPSMNKNLWEHPIIQESLVKLQAWGCSVVWPRISQEKVTMMITGKILDTLFFKFTRVAHNQKKINNKIIIKRLNQYQKKMLGTFQNLGIFLKQNNYNLPTAGCISIKVPEGLLITTSGSDLANLKHDDLALITSWNAKDNSIEWSGKKSPSSESPLHCVLREGNLAKIILHFHSPKMTYSDNLKKFKSTKYYRYGTFGLGHKMIKLLKKFGFAIMKYHGEILLGNSIRDIKININKYNKMA